jgi:pyridoxal 5'-phosphate synthase pdxT subunit
MIGMKKKNLKIGVLALQGAFIEHCHILQKLGVETREIRLPGQLRELDGLIMPGGESTTILKLMHGYGLFQPLKELIGRGFPVWGTCAGMICLAARIKNSQQSSLQPLEVMDITVKRNAFGRQVDSFEIDLNIALLGPQPYHAVFIRAPLIEKVGLRVEILAKLPDGVTVAARQDNILATSFHPELTADNRFHQYFQKIVDSQKSE